MIASPRVVFDTSTLVSVVLRPSSIPERTFSLALEHGIVCASELTLDELGRVLERDKFDRYIGRAERMHFVSLLRSHALIVPLSDASIASVIPSCHDPKDNVFQALAAAAQADLVVSSDDDLLILNSWNGIPIMTPSEFLSWYDQREGAADE